MNKITVEDKNRLRNANLDYLIAQILDIEALAEKYENIQESIFKGRSILVPMDDYKTLVERAQNDK